MLKEKKRSAVIEKKPKPFIAPGSDIPITRKDVEKRKMQIVRAEEIGQSITRVNENEHENPYRVKALVYISKNKPVPVELKNKIKEYDLKQSKLLKQREVKK